MVFVYTIISLAVSVVIVQQNWNIQDENKEIKHRLDVRDAYFKTGLINGAKDREKAYVEIKNYYERVLAHCKTNPCNLPNDLAVLPAERRFEPIESILTKEKE